MRFFFLIYIVLCFLQLDGMSRLPLEVLTAISNKVRYENSSYAHALSESNALDLVSKSFHQIHRERLKNQHQKEVDAAQLITRYALPTTFKDLALLKRGCNILALKSIVSIDTLSFEDKQSMIYSFFYRCKMPACKKGARYVKKFLWGHCGAFLRSVTTQKNEQEIENACILLNDFINEHLGLTEPKNRSVGVNIQLMGGCITL